MTLDYGCPHELLKDPSAKPRRKEAMKLKEASRAAVKALRKWENAAPESEAEESALFEMRMAVRELERLCDDDHPEPANLPDSAQIARH